MAVSVEGLRQRKIVQWAIAYIAGAWLFLEMLGFVAENFGWPAGVVRGATVFLGTGFLVALVVAWFHGEKGHQRATRFEILLIAGLLLVGVASGVYVGRGPERAAVASGALLTPGIDPRSIAVLPFTARSVEGEDPAFFAQGMHEDVITALAKIDSLTVISRASVIPYAGTTKGMREIAEELRVATVLEGSVQRAGGRVRLNVQLIDAGADRHLWAETYDEELTAENVFAIQSSLARKIAASLRATLTPEVEGRIATRPTESLDAYDLYVRGRYLMEESGQDLTKEVLEEAGERFRQAIAADSGYAPAWVGLAGVYISQWGRAYLRPEEALSEASKAAERALVLDPELAEAHATWGWLLGIERRRDEAVQAFERALELNPGSASALRRYAELLISLERHGEAARLARRAVQLAPLLIPNRRALADALFWARDWDGTIAESRELLELKPTYADAHYNLGLAQAMRGERDEAIAALERAGELNPEDPYYAAGLAWAHAHFGEREEALALVGGLSESGAVLKEIAIVYGELGDFDRAFGYLERAYIEDPSSLNYIASDPTADALKADPRFAGLIARLRPP